MNSYKSETLPSGVKVESGYGNIFNLSFGSISLMLTPSDINRLHGIAFPEKKHGCCQAIQVAASIKNIHHIDTLNS